MLDVAEWAIYAEYAVGIFDGVVYAIPRPHPVGAWKLGIPFAVDSLYFRRGYCHVSRRFLGLMAMYIYICYALLSSTT